MNVFGDVKENFAEISAEKVLTLDADAIVYSYGNAKEPEAEQRAAIGQDSAQQRGGAR